jgi:hypothetical protein
MTTPSTAAATLKPRRPSLRKAVARRATGPRTPAGKKRSSRNALKHGIFSKELLLPRESEEEFLSLQEDYKRYWKPTGKPEESLVFELVVNEWRMRRHRLAERDAYRKEPTIGSVTASGKEPFSFEYRLRIIQARGLLCDRQYRRNPDYLEHTHRLLDQLRENAEKGFPESCTRELRTLYGGAEGKDFSDSLAHDYAAVYQFVQKLKENPKMASLDQVVRKVNAAIDKEKENATRLWAEAEQEYKQEVTGMEEAPTLSLPTEIERLCKYQAHLVRMRQQIMQQLVSMQTLREKKRLAPVR